MHKTTPIALLCLCALALAATDIDSLEEEAKTHGLNIVQGLKDLSEQWLAPIYEAGKDPWFYFEQYYKLDLKKIPQADQKVWDLFIKVGYTRCQPDRIESIQAAVEAADIEWFRVGARWKSAGAHYPVQTVMLGNIERHAENCQREYKKQAHDSIRLRLSLEAATFADAVAKASRQHCSPTSSSAEAKSHWQLRPTTASGKQFYSCVARTADIYRDALVSQTDETNFDAKFAEQMVGEGTARCKEVVDEMRAIFNMAQYDAQSFADDRAFGSNDFNDLWIGYGSCTEFLTRDNSDVVAAIAAYKVETRKKTEQKSSLLDKLGLRRKKANEEIDLKSLGAYTKLKLTPTADQMIFSRVFGSDQTRFGFDPRAASIFRED